MRRLSLCLLLAVAGCCYSFYLPGLAPTNFCTEMAKQLDPKANCKVGAPAGRNSIVAIALAGVFCPSDESICARQQA